MCYYESMESIKTNTQAVADAQTFRDLQHAVLVTSVAVNLTVLVAWLTLQIA